MIDFIAKSVEVQYFLKPFKNYIIYNVKAPR